LTWEWYHHIRGYCHPLIFAIFYKMLSVFNLDEGSLMVSWLRHSTTLMSKSLQGVGSSTTASLLRSHDRPLHHQTSKSTFRREHSLVECMSLVWLSVERLTNRFLISRVYAPSCLISTSSCLLARSRIAWKQRSLKWHCTFGHGLITMEESWIQGKRAKAKLERWTKVMRTSKLMS
jgi:hypothetical protein